MGGGATLQLLTSWNLDPRVSKKLENTCFRHFSDFTFFKQKSGLLSAIKEIYKYNRDRDRNFFQFGQNNQVNLYLGLEDVYFLSGLPVDGKPVICGDLDLYDLSIECLGSDNPNRRKNYGNLPCKWLFDNFQIVPDDIDGDDRRLAPYVRAYLLFLIGTVLLPNGTKGTVPIFYLYFLRDIAADALNGFAWGAAALAKLQLCLDKNLKILIGASWLLEHFFMERIRSLREAYIGGPVQKCGEFPAFKGWSRMMAEPSKNVHWNVNFGQILSEVNKEDVEWRPYERFNLAPQRIFFSRTILFDYNAINYHTPEVAPCQLGIQNLDDSQLAAMKRLKTKSKRGHLERKLMVHYSEYIKEWNEERYHSCIRDSVQEEAGFESQDLYTAQDRAKKKRKNHKSDSEEFDDEEDEEHVSDYDGVAYEKKRKRKRKKKKCEKTTKKSNQISNQMRISQELVLLQNKIDQANKQGCSSTSILECNNALPGTSEEKTHDSHASPLENIPCKKEQEDDEDANDGKVDSVLSDKKILDDDLESGIWYISGPHIEKFKCSLSLMKSWNDTIPYAPKIKVWKEYQNEADAISLPEAVNIAFPKI